MKRILLLCLMMFVVWAVVAVDANAQTLRVVTYNIHHARGIDDKVDVGRIARVIQETQADLVALQEVDSGVKRTDRIRIPEELERLTGLHAFFKKNIDFEGGEYGNAILSRFPILKSSNLHYRMIRKGEQRGLLHIVVEAHGRKVVFASTHLDYRPDNEERLSNADEIAALWSASGEMPVIVCGDFNDFPKGELHRKLKATFTDAWDVAGQGDGFTYPSTQPASRIDYVFYSHADVLTAQQAVTTRSEASDHLPLTVTFRVK